jgi:hypothetical protein
MDQAAVQAAMHTLRSQGKSLSAGNIRKVLGYGSLRDILKHREALVVSQGEAVVPVGPGSEGVSGAPIPCHQGRPLCLCGRCGMGRWFEWDIGIWKCELCGIDPPA